MKKYSFSYIVFLLFFSSVINAEELQTPIQPSIKNLIQQVKNSKVKDRRILMNQLKTQLRKMNKESRHSAMVELKKSFSKEHGKKKLHKHQNESKNRHDSKCTHQPKYRHLRHERKQGNGQGQRGGNGNGHK